MALTRTVTNPGGAPVDTQVYDGFKIVGIQLAPAGAINVNRYTPLMQQQIDSAVLTEVLHPGPSFDQEHDALPTSVMKALLAAHGPTHTNVYATMADVGVGGGSLAGLSDVNFGVLADGDMMVYDFATSKWINASAILATKISFNPAGTGLVSTNVQAAIAELDARDVPYDRVAYVADSAAPGGDGSLAKPYVDISTALMAIGQPTNAAEFQENWLIDVLTPGSVFVGNLNVPHRAITIRGQGITIQGNILREISNEKEFGVSGNAWRGTLTLMGLPCDGRDTHQLNREGIRVTGNYRCSVFPAETGNTAHDTYLYDTRIDGTFTADDGVVNGGAPSVGTEVLYAFNTIFNNIVEGRTFYCQRWRHSQVKADFFTVDVIIGMTDCLFVNGDEWGGYFPLVMNVNGFVSGAPNPDPSYNFVDCFFKQTILNLPGPLAVSLDAQSMRTWLTDVTPSAPVTFVLSDDASGVFYNNMVSGLTAIEVQAAIDELASDHPKPLSGVGNPNGAVNGRYPQTFLDTATNTLYMNSQIAVNNTFWNAI